MNTRIVSAFPGTGKSHFFQHRAPELKVLDSDSSLFSWLEPGVRNPDFPRNYLDHIRQSIEQEVDYILVSSHSVVRQALGQSGLPYTAVAPLISCQREYHDRFTHRGSPLSFIDVVDQNWSTWVHDMAKFNHDLIILYPGEYLATAIASLEARR